MDSLFLEVWLAFMGIYIAVSAIAILFPGRIGRLGEEFLQERFSIHLVAFAMMLVLNWLFLNFKPFITFEKWVRG